VIGIIFFFIQNCRETPRRNHPTPCDSGFSYCPRGGWKHGCGASDTPEPRYHSGCYHPLMAGWLSQVPVWSVKALECMHPVLFVRTQRREWKGGPNKWSRRRGGAALHHRMVASRGKARSRDMTKLHLHASMCAVEQVCYQANAYGNEVPMQCD
jgi:hypothetical protein